MSSEQIGGWIGGVFGILALLTLFSGNSDGFFFIIKFGFWALVIYVIYAVLMAFGLFDHFERQKQLNKRHALKVEKDLNEPHRINLKKKILRDAELAGVFSIDDDEIIVTPIVDFLWESFSVSLRSDYHKFNNFDGYGRKIENKKGLTWGQHIFSVVNSVELDRKTKSQLDYVRQLCVYKYSHGENPNLNRGGYNTDYTSSKTPSQKPSEVQKKYIEYFTEAINAKVNSSKTRAFHENMDGIAYEHFCADILRDYKWKVQVLPASNDHGADLIAKKDKITIAIQCKRYSKPYGNSAVQEVVAAIKHYGTDFGVVVSNQQGTSGAKSLAKSNSIPLIRHEDLSELAKIIS